MKVAELKVEYDPQMLPLFGYCTACGQKMPELPGDLQDSADMIAWWAAIYVEHWKLKHSQEDRRRISRD